MDFEFMYVAWAMLTIFSASLFYTWGFKEGQSEGFTRGKIAARAKAVQDANR